MTTIYYNGINPFSGISPTPFVGRKLDMIQYGERWAQMETLTLRGQIVNYNALEPTGGFQTDVSGDLVPADGRVCLNYADFTNLQLSLISGFAQDFQSFQIEDNSTVVYSQDSVKVSSITFDQSTYSYNLPYTIVLQVYPSGFFSGQYGILDPKDTFNFEENRNGVLNLTHVVSARGINTSASESNALQNAYDWVNARKGYSGQILPAFINYSGVSPCLYTESEVINRLAGTYEFRETYTTDLYTSGYGLLRYTCDYSVNADNGISTMVVKGDIIGCRNSDISQVQARYEAFNAYQEAVNQFYKITGRTDLKQLPVSKGVSEDTTHLRLGFTYTFNDDLAPITSFDYKVSFTYDFETDVISANINGKVSSRVLLADRWNTVYNYANQINLYSIILPLYQTYAASMGITYPLDSISPSYSRSENRYEYEIELDETFTNAIIPPAGLNVFDYTINVIPALHQYSFMPVLDGEGSYVVFDLGFNTRKKLTIDGHAIGSLGNTPDGVAETIRQQALITQSQYIQGARPNLDGQSIGFSNGSFGLDGDFRVEYSCEDVPFSL